MNIKFYLIATSNNISSELWKSKGKRSCHSKELQEKSPATTLRLVASLSTVIVINKQTPTNLMVEPKEEIKFQVLIESG